MHKSVGLKSDISSKNVPYSPVNFIINFNPKYFLWPSFFPNARMEALQNRVGILEDEAQDKEDEVTISKERWDLMLKNCNYDIVTNDA